MKQGQIKNSALLFFVAVCQKWEDIIQEQGL
jgi:hypothetical protein